jgi:hypothetical protein
MGKLFFELEDIDTNISDKAYWYALGKYYQSQKVDKIYSDITSYDIKKLSSAKQSLFIGFARRLFEYDPENRRNISELVKHDTEYYTIFDVSKGNVES